MFLRVPGLRPFRDYGLDDRTQSFGFKDEGLELIRTYRSGLKVHGFGFRVEGGWFKIRPSDANPESGVLGATVHCTGMDRLSLTPMTKDARILSGIQE